MSEKTKAELQTELDKANADLKAMTDARDYWDKRDGETNAQARELSTKLQEANSHLAKTERDLAMAENVMALAKVAVDALTVEAQTHKAYRAGIQDAIKLAKV